MPEEYLQAVPDPDEFDRQLRDLTAGRAKPARFQEPSAAERMKPVPLPGRRRTNWRKTRKAKKLRRPVTDPGRDGTGVPRSRRSSGTPGRPRPRSPRRQRLRSAARAIGVLVAFCALLYGLHLLGFGPH